MASRAAPALEDQRGVDAAEGEVIAHHGVARDCPDGALDVIEVTAERVKQHFGAMVRGEVVRYEAPNVRALNFVLRAALGGGGPRSLRSDNLGKSLGGALVRMEIEAPDSVNRRPRPDVAWADAIISAHTT